MISGCVPFWTCNIFLSIVGTSTSNTATLGFAYYLGTTEYMLQVPNFWQLNKWTTVCCTVNSTGWLSAYSNGTLMGQVAGINGPMPTNLLTSNFIARSNWAWNGDGYFAGYMDNFRMYDYALNQTMIQQVSLI